MARVWFVRAEHRLVGVGGGPAYEGPLEGFIWRLDLGLHRFHGEHPIQHVSAQAPTEFRRGDLVLVEVTAQDLGDTSGYGAGFYSSPHSPQEAIRRLGPPAWVAPVSPTAASGAPAAAALSLTSTDRAGSGNS